MTAPEPDLKRPKRIEPSTLKPKAEPVRLVETRPAESEISLRDLVDKVWSGKWIVLAALLASVALVSTWMKYTVPLYTASMMIAPANDSGASGLSSQIARYSGLADLAHVAKVLVVDRLRRAACYRRTLEGLRQLDAHRLSDIGMTHADVESFAWRAALQQVPASQDGPWLLTRIRFHFRRQALIQQLVRLDDRALRDIGIERGNLLATVDQLMAEQAPARAETAAGPAAPGTAAMELLREAASGKPGDDVFTLATARRAA